MRIFYAIILSIIFVIVLCIVYYLHILYIPVEVIFYSALLDLLIAVVIVGIFMFALPTFRIIDWFSKALLIIIWILGGYAFAISIPTVVDRSLSMYILEKIDQRGGGIREDAFERVFVNEYMKEYRLVDVRLTEQLESGTITIQDGCVKLTDRGRFIARVTRFFRQHFLAKNRLLKGGYTDVLVDPISSDSNEKMGYECN